MQSRILAKAASRNQIRTALTASIQHPGLDDLSVTALKGVGPRSAERLARIGVSTVQDLLFHLPLRYQDRTRITPMGAARRGDWVVVEGTVDHSEIRFGRRRSLLVHLSDGTGALLLRFFHFSTSQREGLSSGARLRCFGEVRNGPGGSEMVHPEYRSVSEDEGLAVAETLTPVYPTTEGMQQQTWRDLTDKALAVLDSGAVLREWLPPALDVPSRASLADAVRFLHRPPPDVSLAELEAGRHPAQLRLAYEELLAHQLSLRLVRQAQRLHRAPALRGGGHFRRKLRSSLPFRLTGAQERVLEHIERDLAMASPMQRLIQGDVGSGKTIVAALAALDAVEAGSQVAIMAPTELLAEQHLKNLVAWFEPLGVPVAWLTGRNKGRRRAEVVAALASGEVPVAVGTHALFQDDVAFARLGLVIIDEQHRFGVHQRLALREKGEAAGVVPHQLIMTATPIPRTLAMTAYADLDLSVIDELPPGRTPVKTVVVPDQRRDEVIERVRTACGQGRQAYWVCTLIDESEALQAQAAEDTAVRLAEQLGSLSVGLVHGRLKAPEKEAVMEAFKQGDIDLLVATTVIEVGVDVPNASLMIIENAERLGLAQLHQLRGRVGRGSAESHCVLMYRAPLGDTARQRLNVMRDTVDGFEIARKDLELRGPGEVLGTRQTGQLAFRVADLVRHQHLLEAVQADAERVLSEFPDNAAPLIGRWLGDRTRYGGV
jgi:ATP-dependent DNA helicase RecG